jgi:prefoldin beta subunit
MTDDETQGKVAQLQLLQQNLQNLLVQKQQFQMKLNEIDSALSEIKDAENAYKIVGNVMVLRTKEDLTKELTEKKGTIELRVKSIETQEERLKQKTDDIQKDVMKDMKKDG